MNYRLAEVREFAKEAMARFPELKEWRFGWMGRVSVRVFGRCIYAPKEIILNPDYVRQAPKELVENTVLHEIAHALAYERTGESQGHNAYWKAVCVEIGARPERTNRWDGLENKHIRFKLVHSETGKVYASYLRKPKRRDWPRCHVKGKKEETLGKLKLIAA